MSSRFGSRYKEGSTAVDLCRRLQLFVLYLNTNVCCRPEDEPHESIKPDAYVDNLLQAVEDFLAHSGK